MKNRTRTIRGHDGSMERAFYVVAITPRRNKPLLYPPLTGARALKAMRELERRKIKVAAVTISGTAGDEFEEQLTTAELAEMVEGPEEISAPVALDWDSMHQLSRESICHDSGLNADFARMAWGEMESWVRLLVEDSINRRTGNRVTLQSKPSQSPIYCIEPNPHTAKVGEQLALF